MATVWLSGFTEICYTEIVQGWGVALCLAPLFYGVLCLSLSVSLHGDIGSQHSGFGAIKTYFTLFSMTITLALFRVIKGKATKHGVKADSVDIFLPHN